MSSICKCGKEHKSSVKEVITKTGAVNVLPDIVRRFNSQKPFILADVNTYDAAGEAVCKILADSGIEFSKSRQKS